MKPFIGYVRNLVEQISDTLFGPVQFGLSYKRHVTMILGKINDPNLNHKPESYMKC